MSNIFVAYSIHHILDKIELGTNALDRKLGPPSVKEMVESRNRWFRHVLKRLVETPIRRVDQMEDNSIARGRERPKKTISKTIKRD